MRKSTAVLLSLFTLFLGFSMGLLLAPGGSSYGCNNGTTINNYGKNEDKDRNDHGKD